MVAHAWDRAAVVALAGGSAVVATVVGYGTITGLGTQREDGVAETGVVAGQAALGVLALLLLAAGTVALGLLVRGRIARRDWIAWWLQATSTVATVWLVLRLAVDSS